MRNYVMIITGPKEYLKDSPKIEKFTITQEEIDELREGEESDDEVIEYILEEVCAEWEQRWCKAQVFTENQWNNFSSKIVECHTK
jgi:hypothetical protein